MNLAETAELILHLRLKDDASPQVAKITKATSDAGTAAEKTAGKFASWGTSIKTGVGLAIGQNLVSGLTRATDAVSDFARESIEKASDLNETLSKSSVIFGNSQDDMVAWAKTAATAFGQSETQALDTAAAFGGLFEGVGASVQEAAGLAKHLTELGSDLASFFNTDVQTAIESLRSGLSGESEPLRKYNVFLSETAVNTELLAEGQQKVGGQWTEQQKIMARYKLILQQTGQAQGDFARTSDGLANSLRIQAAEMDNAQAILGQKLLPLQLQFTKAEIAATQAVADFADNYADMKQQLVEVPKSTFLDSLPTEQEVRAALDKLRNVTFTNPDTGEINYIQKALFDLNVNGVKDTWQHQIDDLTAYLAGQWRSQEQELERSSQWKTPFQNLGESAAEAVGDGLQQNLGRSLGQHIVLGRGSSIYANWVLQAKQLGEGTVSALTQGMLDEQDELASGVKTLQDAIKNGITPKQLAAEALGKKLIRWVERGLESEKIGVKETAQGIAGTAVKAILDSGADAKEAGRYLGDLANSGLHDAALEAFLAGKGLSQKQIDGLKALFPEYFKAGVQAAAQFNAGFGQHITRTGVGGAPRRRPGSTSTGGSSGGTRVRAIGGPMVQGFPYIVGEHGQELVVPGISSTVVSNDQLSRLVGARRGHGGFYDLFTDVLGHILDETGRKRVRDLQAWSARLQQFQLGPGGTARIERMLQGNLGQIDAPGARHEINSILAALRTGARAFTPGPVQVNVYLNTRVVNRELARETAIAYTRPR